MDCSPCSTGTVAKVRACGQSSSDSVTTQVEFPASLEQSPMRRKRPGITPPSNAAPRKCAKIEPGTKTGPVDCDAPLATVKKKPIKANQNRDLPTIMSLKLRLLPDRFVAGACFFYSVAQSLHAISSDVPLDDAPLRAKAIAVYCEMCGLSVEESALTMNGDLERGTWGARPQGGLPDHFACLAKHVGGSLVLLRTNTYSIVTSAFGMDGALTSAIVWVPGHDAPLCVHGCGDLEEHCQRATVVVIVEAERDGHMSGGHFRGAVFDHSLQVAPFCTLHGMMSMLPYNTRPVGGFRARHL